MPPTGEDYLDYEKKTRYSSGVKRKKNGEKKDPSKKDPPKNDKKDDKKKKKKGKIDADALASGMAGLAAALKQETYY